MRRGGLLKQGGSKGGGPAPLPPLDPPPFYSSFSRVPITRITSYGVEGLFFFSFSLPPSIN